MNFKRKKSRRKVRCTMCTPHRNGNMEEDRPVRDRRQVSVREATDYLGLPRERYF